MSTPKTTSPRQTQHRAPREERKNKELVTLKRVNHKLARDNARLQKQLDKALEVRAAFEVELEPEEQAEKQAGNVCPACGCPAVRELYLADKKFLVCSECKWRKLDTSL